MRESASTQFEPPGTPAGVHLPMPRLLCDLWASAVHIKTHFLVAWLSQAGETEALDLLASHCLPRSRSVHCFAFQPAQSGRAKLSFPRGRPRGWVNSGQGAGVSHVVGPVLTRVSLLEGLHPGSRKQLLTPIQAEGLESRQLSLQGLLSHLPGQQHCTGVGLLPWGCCCLVPGQTWDPGQHLELCAGPCGAGLAACDSQNSTPHVGLQPAEKLPQRVSGDAS